MACMTRGQVLILHETNASSLVWHNNQAAAMQRSDAMGSMLVWSRDDRRQWKAGEEPPKQFTSCSLTMLRRYMLSRTPMERNVYEIIRETNANGSTVPSKFHMDCDIKSDELDGFAEKGHAFRVLLERDLREFLVEAVDPMFGDARRTPLYCMDSSNERKFSIHYVMGGAMFYNNFHVGALVRRFRERAAEKYGEPSAEHANPYFFDSKTKKFVVDGRVYTFIVDMSIYTPNRAFRLLGNCKYSKNTLLIPHGMSRAQQDSYVFSLDDLQKALVQDPVLAETGPIFSVTELDGNAPRSQGCSRVLLAPGGSAGRASVAQRVDLATEIRQEARHRGTTDAQMVISREHGAAICAAMEEAHPMMKLSPINVKYKPYKMALIVSCTRASMYCTIAMRNHSSSACFFVVDYGRGEYWQRCHKAACLSRSRSVGDRKTWTITPHMRSALAAFFASRACTMQSPVSADVMATLLLDIEAQIPEDYVLHADAGSRDLDGTAIDLFVASEAVPNSQ